MKNLDQINHNIRYQHTTRSCLSFQLVGICAFFYFKRFGKTNTKTSPLDLVFELIQSKKKKQQKNTSFSVTALDQESNNRNSTVR